MNKIEVQSINDKHSQCNSCNEYGESLKISFINYGSRGSSSSMVIKLCRSCASILKNKLIGVG